MKRHGARLGRDLGEITNAEFIGRCTGRLTTETAVPVSTSDRTAQGTLYFTPYFGNRLQIFYGKFWKMWEFSELSIAAGGGVADRNADIFVEDNAGTLALSAIPWTNDTTRATALVLQDGVYVKSGDLGKTYLGTYRSTTTTTTEDSAAKRFVWNAYNRVQRKLLRQESTDTWTYSTATWRAANNNTDNKVEVVVGLAGPLVDLTLTSMGSHSGATQLAEYTGIDVDYNGTAVNDADMKGVQLTSTVGGNAGCTAVTILKYIVATAGYHSFTWVEKAGDATATYTWFGDVGIPADFQFGLAGIVEA